MTDCIFQLRAHYFFLQCILILFSIEGWSLCSLFSIMERLLTTLEAVLRDFWNYTRGFSFCLVFLWCSLLEPAPMMEDAQAARRSLADSSIWSRHWQPLQPPDMEGSECLDEWSPSYGVASAKVLMWRRGVTNISFQNSQLTHRTCEHSNCCFIPLSVFSCSNGSTTVGMKKEKWK